MANLKWKLRKLRADTTLTGLQVIQESHRMIGGLQWERSRAAKRGRQAAVTIAEEANRLAVEEVDLRKWLRARGEEIRKFYRPNHKRWYQAWWWNPLKWFGAAKMAKLRFLCTYIAADDFVGSESTLDCLSPVDYDDYQYNPIARTIFNLSRLFKGWWDALAHRVDKRIKRIKGLKPEERKELRKATDKKSSIFNRYQPKVVGDNIEKREDLIAVANGLAAKSEKYSKDMRETMKQVGVLALQNSGAVSAVMPEESRNLRKEWELLFKTGASLEHCTLFFTKHIAPVVAERVSLYGAIEARRKELEPVITQLRSMIALVIVAKNKGWSTPLKIASVMVKHNNMAIDHGLTWRRGTLEYDYNPTHDVKLFRRYRPDLFSDRARQDSSFVSDQPCRDDFRLHGPRGL